MPEPIEFYWSPAVGETIVSMVNYRDMILLATNRGVYIIREKVGHGLEDHEVTAVKLEVST